MSPHDLNAAELAVYTSAFGAEFSRAFVLEQSKHQERMQVPGATYDRVCATEVACARGRATVVAQLAVEAFRQVGNQGWV